MRTSGSRTVRGSGRAWSGSAVRRRVMSARSASAALRDVGEHQHALRVGALGDAAGGGRRQQRRLAGAGAAEHAEEPAGCGEHPPGAFVPGERGWVGDRRAHQPRVRLRRSPPVHPAMEPRPVPRVAHRHGLTGLRSVKVPGGAAGGTESVVRYGTVGVWTTFCTSACGKSSSRCRPARSRRTATSRRSPARRRRGWSAPSWPRTGTTCRGTGSCARTAPRRRTWCTTSSSGCARRASWPTASASTCGSTGGSRTVTRIPVGRTVRTLILLIRPKAGRPLRSRQPMPRSHSAWLSSDWQPSTLG